MSNPEIPEDEQGLPALREIPRERWREVLRPYPHLTRKLALGGLGRALTPDEWLMLAELELEDPLPMRVATPRVPEGTAVPAPPARRQVNISLGGERYEQLTQASVGVGLKPAQLARLLVVRGVDQMLRSR